MSLTLDPVFTRVTYALRKQAEERALALIGQGDFGPENLDTRRFDDNQLIAPDPADEPAVHEFFARRQAHRTYSDAIEKPDTVKLNQALAAQVQSDFLAACERDYKQQRCVSRVRATMLAASRRYAHGHDLGPIARGLVAYPARLMTEGR